MKKINLIGIEFAVLIILILIPFVNSYNIYGNGSDAQQNMCGDGFCQPTETATSCPADCTSPKPLPNSPTTNPPTNTSSINQPSSVQNNNSSTPSSTNQFSNNVSVNQPASAGNVPTQNTSSANITIKIIIGVITLIIIGIIIYLIIRKKKNSNIKNLNSAPAVSNQ